MIIDPGRLSRAFYLKRGHPRPETPEILTCRFAIRHRLTRRLPVRMLRASISELCVADHGNDCAVLERWLSNKTPAKVAAWTQDSDHPLLVAVEGEAILAVGAVRETGEITMN